MNGPKKVASFPLIRNGELIPVDVMLNEQTNFSKLRVGKQVVKSKSRKGSKNSLFPLIIAVGDLAPL